MAGQGVGIAMTTKNDMEAFREGVGNRLREVEAHFKNRSRAAETAGVSKSTFQRWVNGEVDPSFTGLANIAQETGVSLDWLAWGSGDIYGRTSVAPKAGRSKGPLTIDEDLLAQIAEGISAVYADEGTAVSPAQLGRAAAAMLNQLFAAYEDPAERRIGVKILLQQFRAGMRATARSGR